MSNADFNSSEGMNVEQPGFVRVPIWFWVVVGIGLLWNLVGVSAFVAETFITEEALAEMPEAQQKMYRNLPAWYTVVFAGAVGFGTIGCVLMMVRKKLATSAFGISLACLIAQQFYLFAIANTLEVMGAAALALPAMVMLIAIGLLALSVWATVQGWLR